MLQSSLRSRRRYVGFEVFTACHLLARCFAELFYNPEDGGDTFLRNAGYHSTHYTASYPKRRYSSRKRYFSIPLYQVGIVRSQPDRCNFYFCLIGKHLTDSEYLISSFVMTDFNIVFLKDMFQCILKLTFFCEAIFVIVAELILLYCSVSLSKYILWLVPSQENVDLYIHFPICLHGIQLYS
jgi:hypothetical protein